MLCKQAIKINLDIHRIKSFIVYYIDGRIKQEKQIFVLYFFQNNLWIKLLQIFFSRCGVSAPSCVKKDGSSLVHYSLKNLLQWKVSSQKKILKNP